ncbi:MAG: hypothetical protein ACK4UP_08820 [Spirosomataceae bacterium]
MKGYFRFIVATLCVFSSFVSFAKQESEIILSVYPSFIDGKDSLGHTLFWTKLSDFCGMAFEGKVTEGADNDTFKDKRMVMHVKACEGNQIKIPFYVGEDRSRTWVLTQTEKGILLKHDHRHEDGTPDKVTMYGGLATNSGTAKMQVFPADQETVDFLPAAAANVWWITVDATKFTYNLRRMGSNRLFTVEFDLTKPLETLPPAPWGWGN